MTTLEFTATVDRINARAATVDWRRLLLAALMILPFVVFYAVRLVVRAVGWLVAWVWAAGMEGWAAAGPRQASG